MGGEAHDAEMYTDPALAAAPHGADFATGAGHVAAHGRHHGLTGAQGPLFNG